VNVTVRLAKDADVKSARAIRVDAAAALTQRYGSGHWSGEPSIATLKRHKEAGALYVVECDGDLVGTFKLDDKKIGFYRKAWFTRPDDPAAYLMNMAIAPERQREGIGRKTMVEIEGIVRRRALKALRFDAYDGPAGAGGFYRKCGYELMHKGTINGTALEYYEKLLG